MFPQCDYLCSTNKTTLNITKVFPYTYKSSSLITLFVVTCKTVDTGYRWLQKIYTYKSSSLITLFVVTCKTVDTGYRWLQKIYTHIHTLGENVREFTITGY